MAGESVVGAATRAFVEGRRVEDDQVRVHRLDDVCEIAAVGCGGTPAGVVASEQFQGEFSHQRMRYRHQHARLAGADRAPRAFSGATHVVERAPPADLVASAAPTETAAANYGLVDSSESSSRRRWRPTVRGRRGSASQLLMDLRRCDSTVRTMTLSCADLHDEDVGRDSGPQARSLRQRFSFVAPRLCRAR